jgi:hypothetical protein
VEYADKVYFDYDGSQVPAEWFGWLHYKTDLPPHKVKFQNAKLHLFPEKYLILRGNKIMFRTFFV